MSNYYHIKKRYDVQSKLEFDDISESFGISGSYTKSITNMYIPDDFDILYITGESGCGKTTILNTLIDKLNIHAYSITESEYKYDSPVLSIVEQCGLTESESIGLLTSVGLSDVTLWLTKYSNLSDSEKYRFHVAYNSIFHDIIVVDEFLSTLDRKTAKAVSYSIQKFVRKKNKRLIVATAHTDLTDYLNPDFIIEGKSFPSRFKLIKNQDTKKNVILDSCEFIYGTKYDYNQCELAELHYRGKYVGGTKEYLFCKYDSDVIGVLVSTYNMHTGGRRISRLVVHPCYRGVGIGTEIVKRYINDYKNTDVIASMGLYVPVFESAGMKRLDDVIVESPNGLKRDLLLHDFDFSQWSNKEYLYTFCSSYDVRNTISKYSNHASSYVCPGGVYLTDEQIKNKLIQEVNTSARVLYNFRERKMAKYST